MLETCADQSNLVDNLDTDEQAAIMKQIQAENGRVLSASKGKKQR
jgi:hypothetical protein